MELRVRVGASKDASFDAVFRSYTDTARAANAMVTADDRRHTKLQEKLLLDKLKVSRDIAKAEMAETKAIHENERRMLAQSVAQRSRVRMQAIESESKKELAIATETAKAKAAIEIAQAKEVARREREIAVAESKIQLQAQRGRQSPRSPGGDFAQRVAFGAMRNLSPITPMLSLGGRMASDIARGAGIDFNFSSLVGNSVQAQQQAVSLSNAAFMPGEKGAAGRRQDPAVIAAEAKKVADETGFGRGEALSGLQKFVGVSGDLETGRAVLKDMAMLAKATDSSLDDMVEAAGNAANQLGDAKDKGALLHSIMAAVAGQGKIGAVEIKDMAHQMASLAAQAPMFGGNPADNIMMMGVLAQEARQRGGAKSAAQATTAVTSFVNTLTKGARLKEMMAAGVIKNPEEIRTIGPQELITRMLTKTQGKELPMNKLVMDVQAKRAVRGFQILFNQAGGGDAGIKAVTAEFDRLKKATMENAEIQDSFKAAMDTSATKAQLFQNKLQDVADKMAEKALPAMEKLEPMALDVVGGLGRLVESLADNPFAIIPVAIGAAIAKSGADQAMRAGVENIFRNFSGGGAPAGVFGNLAAGLTIAAIAFTTVKVGEMFVDSLMDHKKRTQEDAIRADLNASEAANAGERKLSSGEALTADELENAKKKAAEVEGSIAKVSKGSTGGVVGDTVNGILRMGAKLVDGQAVRTEDRVRDEQLKSLMVEHQRLLNIIATGELKVRVVNHPAAQAPVPHTGGLPRTQHAATP